MEEYNIEEAFFALMKHVKNQQVKTTGSGFYVKAGFKELPYIDPQDTKKADPRKLALSVTNLEQAIMWYYAAFGEQPAPLKKK